MKLDDATTQVAATIPEDLNINPAAPDSWEHTVRTLTVLVADALNPTHARARQEAALVDVAALAAWWATYYDLGADHWSTTHNPAPDRKRLEEHYHSWAVPALTQPRTGLTVPKTAALLTLLADVAVLTSRSDADPADDVIPALLALGATALRALDEEAR